MDEARVDAGRVTLAEASAAQLMDQLRSKVAEGIRRRRDVASKDEAEANEEHKVASEAIEDKSREVLGLLADAIRRADADPAWGINGQLRLGKHDGLDGISVTVNFDPILADGERGPKAEFFVQAKIGVGADLAASVAALNRAAERYRAAKLAMKEVLSEEADEAMACMALGLERASANGSWPKAIAKGPKTTGEDVSRGLRGHAFAAGIRPPLASDEEPTGDDS
jgi:hypothetical protein